MMLIEQSARTIFGSLHTAIVYANALHHEERRWVVYKLPRREDFTVCLERDAHFECDSRFIIHTTGGGSASQ